MPNKKKGFKRSCIQPPPSVSHPKKSNRSLKRKQWTDEQMLAAIESVQTDHMSGNKAADLHGVPRSTLKDRLSGRVSHGTKSGPVPYLSVTEEEELSTHLLDASKIGYGKTRRDVMCLVETYVRQKGTLRGSKITDGLWQNFMKRNPSPRLRAGDATAGVRMDAINAENCESTLTY